MRQNRYSYTRYFNSKYHRTGPLGESEPFISELVGLKHTQAALSYIFRQGLHHGLSSTPFGYRHSSVNVIFKDELGKWIDERILPEKSRYKYMPRAFECDMSGYRMSSNGLFLREDIIDKSYVEELFISPRNFTFYMNRLSGEEWEREQIDEDNTIDIVNLKSIERHTTVDMISRMIENERGRIDKWRMTDMELCEIIDKEYIPKYHCGKASIYELTDSQRASLGNRIYDDFRKLWRNPSLKGHQKNFTVNQLRRCLVIR
ncbi:MAG: hypothetical protein MJY56_07050 [Bacteroidales bacterium]|nr:hypothetical protein [Bacteroidales bacterium]